MGGVMDARNGTLQERKRLERRLDALTRLDEFHDFEELDWASVATEIARLTEERKKLEAASDTLRQLNEQLRERLEARKKNRVRSAGGAGEAHNGRGTPKSRIGATN